MLETYRSSIKSNTRPHTHQAHELIICTAGSAYVCAKNKKHTISSTQTILVPAGILHHYEVAQKKDHAKSTFICFEGNLPGNLSPELQADFNKHLTGEITSASLDTDTAEEVIELTAMLMRSLGSNKAYTREKAWSILNAILVSHLTALDYSGQARRDARMEKIQRIVDWIDKNFAEEISIETAAEKAYMSRSVFTRSFKKYTSLTFANYVTNARQKYAAGLLIKKNLPIGEVAYQCGYRNLGHFYAQFQERHGMTPSQYRKMAIEMTTPAPSG